MKESNLAKTDLPKWQEKNGKDSYLCRNNTGAFETKSGGWITFGIGLIKKIKGKFKTVGGGDYIGWTTVTLCDILQKEGCVVNNSCDSCTFKNKKVAIFTSREYKTKNVKLTKYQKEWHGKVIDSGGISEVIYE